MGIIEEVQSRKAMEQKAQAYDQMVKKQELMQAKEMGMAETLNMMNRQAEAQMMQDPRYTYEAQNPYPQAAPAGPYQGSNVPALDRAVQGRGEVLPSPGMSEQGLSAIYGGRQ